MARAKASIRDRQREDTRQRIYEAALDIFRRDGVAASRIDDIAKAAGVSHGAFYFHFATKEDVLVQRLRLSERTIVEALDVLPFDAPLTQVLDTVCSTMTAEWEGDPKLFPAVGAVGLRIASTRPASADAHAVRGALAERFRAAAERGELSPVLPPEVLSDILLVNVFAAALSWCAEPIAPLGTTLRGAALLFLHGARGVLQS